MKSIFNPMFLKRCTSPIHTRPISPFFSFLFICCAGILLVMLSFNRTEAQTIRYVGTQLELTNAISASANGDVISFTKNIVVNSEVSLTKSITIEGNNYIISVPITGLNDQGQPNAGASGFRVFSCNTAATAIIINNLIIKGGYLTGSGQHGATIDVSQASALLTLNNCIISNGLGNGMSSGVSNGGGGIRNAGKLFLNNCFLRRNAAQFGGALLNENTGIAFIEQTTMSENRATSKDGGGGAIENRMNGQIYFNNSTLSNNQSQIVGGAVNNLSGLLYFINSSATGNVVYGPAAGGVLVGGSLSNNGGDMYIINSLMAHNYRRSGGTEAAPTAFILDDMVAYSMQNRVHMQYSIYHAAMPAGMGTNLNNIQYTGNINGSDNSIFSGGDFGRITNFQGLSIGTAMVYRPFLYSEGEGTLGPTLKSGSFLTQPGNAGTPTRFANNGGTNMVVSYWNGAAYVAVNTMQVGNSGHLVKTDQTGVTRANPPCRGAIESIVSTVYMVKVEGADNGSVTGGSAYGDVHPAGTTVTLTAIPKPGFVFTRWDWVLGGAGPASTSNPYNLTVNQNMTFVPVFTAAAVGTYSITYVGNGNTGGSAPVTQTYSASTTIANSGILVRKGYVFTGWNTSPHGTGTTYSEGMNYSAGTSQVLYAQWQEILWMGGISTDGGNIANWLPNQIPANGTSFSIAANAGNNLVLPGDYNYATISFRGGGRKVVLGNYNLTVEELVAANANNYVLTNGSGRLIMSTSSLETKTFPIGNSAFNPVQITNRNGVADVFSVLVRDDVYADGSGGTPITGNRVTRTWDINKANPNTGSGVDFTFNWNSGEESMGDISVPVLVHYSGSWVKQTGTTTATATSLSYAGYTGTFSPFAVVEANIALPLSWISFTATNQQDEVLLNWITAAEQHTKDFLVQHSMDGLEWSSIGSVKATGNNRREKEYSFLHSPSAKGYNFYRLLQRDLDGKETYSKVVRTLVGAAFKVFRILGNPVINNQMKIHLTQAAHISIYTSSGSLVFGRYLGEGIQTVLLNGLSKGNYYIKAENQTELFIIQ